MFIIWFKIRILSSTKLQWQLHLKCQIKYFKKEKKKKKKKKKKGSTKKIQNFLIRIFFFSFFQHRIKKYINTVKKKKEKILGKLFWYKTYQNIGIEYFIDVYSCTTDKIYIYCYNLQ
jgi:hypothetical protein